MRAPQSLHDVSERRARRDHRAIVASVGWWRLGITLEQIRTYDLPTKPRKVGDRRSLQVASTVEAEAMPAAILRKLLRTEIENLLPADALMVAKVAEKSEREVLNWTANNLLLDDPEDDE